MKSSLTQLERRFGIASSTTGFIDGAFEMAGENVLLNVFVPTLGVTSFLSSYQYDTISFTSENNTSFFPCSFNPQDTPMVKGMPRPGFLHTSAMIGPLSGFLLGSLFARLYVDIGFVDTDAKGFIFSSLNSSLVHFAPLPIKLSRGSSMLTFTLYIYESKDLHCCLLFCEVHTDLTKRHETSVPDNGTQLSSFLILDTITITPSDSRWVGAWWMNFLVAGVIALISGIPFLFLPKSLDKKEEACIQKNLDPTESNIENSHGQKPDIQGGMAYSGQLKGEEKIERINHGGERHKEKDEIWQSEH
ncbi:hypothetical protein Chor_009814 [Crotalus horridus]